MTVKTLVFAGACAFSILTAPAWAQSPMAAADFAMKASVGNTFEVEESNAALKQATSPKLKAFAKMMIQDHTMAEKKLGMAAKPAGAMVEMKLDEPHQAMLTALQGKTGADFDKAYVADQVAAHQETAALLSDYEKTGTDAKLKAWAMKTLPVVQMHAKKIGTISSSMAAM